LLAPALLARFHGNLGVAANEIRWMGSEGQSSAVFGLGGDAALCLMSQSPPGKEGFALARRTRLANSIIVNTRS
jgi:hypothetical protein